MSTSRITRVDANGFNENNDTKTQENGRCVIFFRLREI